MGGCWKERVGVVVRVGVGWAFLVERGMGWGCGVQGPLRLLYILGWGVKNHHITYQYTEKK